MRKHNKAPCPYCGHLFHFYDVMEVRHIERESGDTELTYCPACSLRIVACIRYPNGETVWDMPIRINEGRGIIAGYETWPLPLEGIE